MTCEATPFNNQQEYDMTQAARKYAVSRVCALVVELVEKRTAPARKQELKRYRKHRDKVLALAKRQAAAIEKMENTFIKDSRFDYNPNPYRNSAMVVVKDDSVYMNGETVHHATIARPYIDDIMLASDKELAAVLARLQSHVASA